MSMFGDLVGGIAKSFVGSIGGGLGKAVEGLFGGGGSGGSGGIGDFFSGFLKNMFEDKSDVKAGGSAAGSTGDTVSALSSEFGKAVSKSAGDAVSKLISGAFK